MKIANIFLQMESVIIDRPEHEQDFSKSPLDSRDINIYE